jgi:NADPH-dependent curcumin reductase CurA
MAEGTMQGLETVIEGFDELPNALNMLFDGKNTGKLVVRIA